MTRSETFVVASMGRRLGAWLIDMILLLIAVSILAAFLGLYRTAGPTTWTGSNGTTWTTTTYYLDTVSTESLLAILSALYAVPLWRWLGGTLSQRLLGLRVFHYSEPKPLGWVAAAVRWFVLFGWTIVGIASYLSSAFTLAAIIWLLALLVSAIQHPQKRALHDRASGSLVVHLEPAWAAPLWGDSGPAPAAAKPADPLWHDPSRAP